MRVRTYGPDGSTARGADGGWRRLPDQRFFASRDVRPRATTAIGRCRPASGLVSDLRFDETLPGATVPGLGHPPCRPAQNDRQPAIESRCDTGDADASLPVGPHLVPTVMTVPAGLGFALSVRLSHAEATGGGRQPFATSAKRCQAAGSSPTDSSLPHRTSGSRIILGSDTIRSIQSSSVPPR